MFKERQKKLQRTDLVVRQLATLDAHHQQFIRGFEHVEEDERLKARKVATIRSEIESLKRDIRREEEKNADPNTERLNTLWEEVLSRTDRLSELRDVGAKQTAIEYYESTGHILFKYYDLLEKEKEGFNQMPSLEVKRQIHGLTLKPQKSVLDYFCERNLQESVEVEGLESIERIESLENIEVLDDHENQENQERLDNQESQEKIDNQEIKDRDKIQLINDYMVATNSDYVKSIKDEYKNLNMCNHCLTTEYVHVEQDGIAICPTCGSQQIVLIEHDRPSYREPVKDASYFSYRRINHFNEWLSQAQGKETTDIPDEIYDKIIMEIKKEKITDTRKLDHKKMRQILKTLGINKYYEHTPHLINRINGIAPLHLSQDLEEQLRSMFKEIQAPFLKSCPKTRKNFLSYSYVLHKFLQLLEKDEYLQYFPLLKSREKLHVQDEIWKKICQELNYQFIKSI